MSLYFMVRRPGRETVRAATLHEAEQVAGAPLWCTDAAPHVWETEDGSVCVEAWLLLPLLARSHRPAVAA